MSTGQISSAISNKKHLHRETLKGRGMLKNLILRWAESIHRNEHNGIEIDRTPRIDSDHGITFTVYKASGGAVIETRFYDDTKDRSQRGLYVITDDHDMGKEIGKIITIETLKR